MIVPIPPFSKVSMRVPLIPPQHLSPAQKPLYDDMQTGMKSNFNAF